MALSVQYAQSTSKGALVSEIGWLDFGDKLNLMPGDSAAVKNTIPGNYVITFTLSLTETYSDTSLGVPVAFKGFTTPVLESSAVSFGNTGYTGINGNVALYMNNESARGVDTISTITISDISVVDSSNNPVSDYAIIAADAEATDKVERWSVKTNGSKWRLLDILPAPDGYTEGGPVISGVGTDTVSEAGVNVNIGSVSGPAYITDNPTQLVASCLTNLSREGFAFGVIVVNEVCDCFSKEIITDSCCCEGHNQDFVQNSVVDKNVSFAVRNLRITITGTIGGQPFTAEAVGVYSGIPSSPILYFPNVIPLGPVQSAKFIPNLGFNPWFNFLDKMCMPANQKMKLIECFDNCLSIGCIQPSDNYYSVSTDLTSEAQPAIPYACFQAQADLSLFISKTNYLVVKKILPVISGNKD